MMQRDRIAFERGIICAIDLPAQVPAVRPRVASIFKEIGAESAEALAAAMGKPDRSTILTRFANRRRCFGNWIEDQIVAYGWVSHTAECIGEQERVIQLQPREAYVWDCATLPEYRGRGLYGALLGHIVAMLQDEGARRVWIGSSLDNGPSLRGITHVGFQPALTLVSARIFGIRCFFAARPHKAPSALVAAARCALSVEPARGLGPIIFERTHPVLSPPCGEMET